VLLAVDVHYGGSSVTTAAVGFADWRDEASALEHVVHHAGAPEAYEPGSFFKRELPHLVRVIEQVRAKHEVTTVVIDAHVRLEAPNTCLQHGQNRIWSFVPMTLGHIADQFLQK